MEQNEQTRAFFDQMADAWDTYAQHDPAKVAAIVTLCDIRQGARVLDIGCGTGVLTPYLLKWEPSAVLGVDLSPRMIAHARAKYQSARVAYEACDVMDVAAREFDVAVIYSAYPHFLEKARLAAQVAALLRTGGRFMIAHSQGRDVINGRHKGKQVAMVSVPLKPACEEAEVWRDAFAIDTLVDTGACYMLSGVKK